MTCEKICYDEQQAEFRMKYLNKINKGNPDWNTFKNVYFCDYCEAWHLSSKSKLDVERRQIIIRFKRDYIRMQEILAIESRTEQITTGEYFNIWIKVNGEEYDSTILAQCFSEMIATVGFTMYPRKGENAPPFIFWRVPWWEKYPIGKNSGWSVCGTGFIPDTYGYSSERV